MRRRTLIAGLGAFIVAPSLVRASSLMPVRPPPLLRPTLLAPGGTWRVSLADGEYLLLDGNGVLQARRAMTVTRAVFRDALGRDVAEMPTSVALAAGDTLQLLRGEPKSLIVDGVNVIGPAPGNRGAPYLGWSKR